MSIKAILSAPRDIVVGASNVRIALAEDYALEASDMVVSGDVPIESRVFGAGRWWYYQFGVSEDETGEFTVGLSDAFRAKPVVVAYDTVRSVEIRFGEAQWDGRRVSIPVSVSEPLIGLEKSCFRLRGVAGRCYLYGKDRAYELVIVPNEQSGVFRVSVARQVCKSNGIHVDAVSESVEVQYGEASDSSDR